MANIKRGWGTSMTPAGTGAYRGGSSRVTRAGGHRTRKGSDGGLNKVIKTAEKAAAPKGLRFRHPSVGGGGGIAINPKIGGGQLGMAQRTPWRKKRILN
jgi:hypothetical protein